MWQYLSKIRIMGPKIMIYVVYINLLVIFQLTILKQNHMFFDSLIKKKQIVLSSTSPRFDSNQDKREIFICDFGAKMQQNRVQENMQILNRSKSQKQFYSPNSLGLHLKHPILSKQKINGRQNSNIQKYQTQVQLRQNKLENIQKNRINLYDKQPKKLDKYERQNDRHTDLNDYQLKNSKKKGSNNYKLMSTRQLRDLPALNSYSQCNAFHSSSKNSQISDFRDKNQHFYNNQELTSTLPSQFIFDKYGSEYFQQSSKIINQNANLKLVVNNLQRQISAMNRQRDRDKSKLLEFSITIDKLKFQNDCLKKNITKSKENLDLKNKDNDYKQFYELKRILKEEMDSKEMVQKQRKNILKELNESLVFIENEKVKWQKQRKIMQNKIDGLVLQVRQKKNQNVSFAQKSNAIFNENKKLKQGIEKLQKQLGQKQKQVQWMNSKVIDLKAILQNIKNHQKNRIQKLQQQLNQAQNKKKVNQLNATITELEDRIIEKQKIIVNLRQQIQSNHLQLKTVRQKNTKLLSQLADNKDDQAQQFEKKQKLLNEQINQKFNQIQQLQRKNEKQRKIHEQLVMDKNKIIQALAKNQSDAAIQYQSIKKDKIMLQNELSELKNKEKFYQLQLQKLKVHLNELNNRYSDLSKKASIKQMQFVEKQTKLKELSECAQAYDRQRKSLFNQIQRYKGYWFSLTEEKRLKQQEIKSQNKQLNDNKQQLIKIERKNEQLKRIIDDKEKHLSDLEKELETTKRQWLQSKYRIQCLTKEVEKKQREIANKQYLQKGWQNQRGTYLNRIKQAQQQLKTIRHNQKQLQNENMALTRAKAQLNSVPASNYSQLQMRLCSILGIYLTTNIQKIVGPIEQIIKLKRKLQVSARYYQQLLTIFQVKENTIGSNENLISQMKNYKTNYLHILQLNQINEEQLNRVKKQNEFLINRNDQYSHSNRKLEAIVDDYNEIITRQMLKIGNQKFSSMGNRKY